MSCEAETRTYNLHRIFSHIKSVSTTDGTHAHHFSSSQSHFHEGGELGLNLPLPVWEMRGGQVSIPSVVLMEG